MSEVAKSGVCVRCGKTLRPGEDAEGTCPQCLFQWAFAADPGETRPAGSRAVPDAGVEAELSGRFGLYAIEGLLGRGGMGVVYRARHESLGRQVAIKVLPEALARDVQFTDRFQREARAMASLSHPRIVGIHDFGCLDGRYYFAMELVEGGSLREQLKRGALPPARALAILPELCEALQYAHDRGVIHRDIKPENILLDRQGHVKVGDFGLAKIVGGSDPEYRQLTRSDLVVGTMHYMAPEQIERPKVVDHRADLYSAGVVLYEMLTGELPLGRFDPPSAKTTVGPALDEVVLRALEKDPGRRWAQAADFAAAAREQANAPAAGPLATAGRAPAAHAPRKRGVVALAVAGSLLFACLGSGAVMWLRFAGSMDQVQKMELIEAAERQRQREDDLAMAKAEPARMRMAAENSARLREQAKARLAEAENAARLRAEDIAKLGAERAQAREQADPLAVGAKPAGVNPPLTPEEEEARRTTDAIERRRTDAAIVGARARLAEAKERLLEHTGDLKSFPLGPVLYEDAVKQYDDAERTLAQLEGRASVSWKDPQAGMSAEEAARDSEIAHWVERLSSRHSAQERRIAALTLVAKWPHGRARLQAVADLGGEGGQRTAAVLAEYALIERLRAAGQDSLVHWTAAWDLLHDDPDRFGAVFRAVHDGSSELPDGTRKRVDLAQGVLDRFMSGWSETTSSDLERATMGGFEKEVREAGLAIVPGLVKVLEEDMLAAFSRVSNEPFGSVWTRKFTARDQVKAIFALAWIGRPETIPQLAHHLKNPSLTAASNACAALAQLAGQKFAGEGEAVYMSGETLARAKDWWEQHRVEYEPAPRKR